MASAIEKYTQLKMRFDNIIDLTAEVSILLLKKKPYNEKSRRTQHKPHDTNLKNK